MSLLREQIPQSIEVVRSSARGGRMRKMQQVFTIGYGAKPLEQFLNALSRRGIQYLIDVRSSPRSTYRPEFSSDALENSLKGTGITYVLMGDSLGGRPEDPTCYEHGHVLYDLVRERNFFKAGIRRIQHALSKDLRICLMCSEGKPEDCHRSKLIGVALRDLGIDVVHIGTQEEEFSQEQVLARIAPAQPDLFGLKLASRKAYKAAR
jgi:uncharacterized protein (DUF488 family)